MNQVTYETCTQEVPLAQVKDGDYFFLRDTIFVKYDNRVICLKDVTRSFIVSEDSMCKGTRVKVLPPGTKITISVL